MPCSEVTLSPPGVPASVESTIGSGTPFHAPGLLFAKLDDDQLAEWTHRFAGME